MQRYVVTTTRLYLVASYYLRCVYSRKENFSSDENGDSIFSSRGNIPGIVNFSKIADEQHEDIQRVKIPAANVNRLNEAKLPNGYFNEDIATSSLIEELNRLEKSIKILLQSTDDVDPKKLTIYILLKVDLKPNMTLLTLKVRLSQNAVPPISLHNELPCYPAGCL